MSVRGSQVQRPIYFVTITPPPPQPHCVAVVPVNEDRPAAAPATITRRRTELGVSQKSKTTTTTNDTQLNAHCSDDTVSSRFQCTANVAPRSIQTGCVIRPSLSCYSDSASARSWRHPPPNVLRMMRLHGLRQRCDRLGQGLQYSPYFITYSSAWFDRRTVAARRLRSSFSTAN